MYRKKLLSCLLFPCLTLAIAVADEAPAPKVSGTLTVSITQGTIDADMTITDMPPIKDYLLRLNRGLNVEFFRNPEQGFNYGTEQQDVAQRPESTGYYLPDSTGKAKFLPSSIRIKYTGKFPVYDDPKTASDQGDWRGHIAFNGKTLRTDAEQAAWLPVLYDVAHDRDHVNVRYDIRVRCDDCTSLYINGSAPVKAHDAEFVSARPVEPALLLGNYDFQKVDGNFYLNTGLDAQGIKALSSITTTAQRYDAAHLDIPYGQAVSYVGAVPTSNRNGWAFVSYPTIFVVGPPGKYSLIGMVAPENRVDTAAYLYHELGHYYFGTLRQFNSPLGGALEESLTEYLADRGLHDTNKDFSLAANLQKKLDYLKGRTCPAFKQEPRGQGCSYEAYAYNFAPLIWFAVQQEIGVAAMDKWLHLMITEPTTFTDYHFMMKTLGEVVRDKAKLEKLESHYFSGPAALANAEMELRQHQLL